MQTAIDRAQQDLDVQTAWKSLMHTGRFSANDMTVLVRMWAYHYFGGNSEMPPVDNYSVVTGLKHYQYAQLRAKLRKVGVFSWDKHTKEWLIRRPDMWLAEHLGRSAHEAAAKARRADVRVRKALKASNAVQLELV